MHNKRWSCWKVDRLLHLILIVIEHHSVNIYGEVRFVKILLVPNKVFDIETKTGAIIDYLKFLLCLKIPQRNQPFVTQNYYLLY